MVGLPKTALQASGKMDRSRMLIMLEVGGTYIDGQIEISTRLLTSDSD